MAGTVRDARRVAAVLAVIAGLTLAWPSPAGAVNPWVRVPAPSPGPEQTELRALSCVNATTCVAVGSFTTGAFVSRTLVLRTTNGTTWTRVPSPSPGDSALDDISCTSATNCTAVGVTSTGAGDADALVLRTTDGSSWKRIATPALGGADHDLSGVSCVTATRCRAVGSVAPGRTLVLRTSDGASWFRQSSPSRGLSSYLRSVDCTSNVSCTAVGGYLPQPPGSPARTLALHTTDGRTWSRVVTPSPSPNTTGNDLWDVDCTSRLHCTAVGGTTSAVALRGLVVRTTDGGTTWQRRTTPPASGPVVLQGVSCQSATQCSAVGHKRDGPATLSFTAALLRTTNGSTWTSPNPGSERAGRDLHGVACPTATTCVAGGILHPSGGFDLPTRSLVLRET
jgi:photosystem II stability/assembly factor-like uncharacterized protein